MVSIPGDNDATWCLQSGFQNAPWIARALMHMSDDYRTTFAMAINLLEVTKCKIPQLDPYLRFVRNSLGQPHQ